MHPDQQLERRLRDQQAHNYEAAQHRMRTRWFVWARDKAATLALGPMARILDAGCGTGSALEHFDRFASTTIIGVDLSTEFLKVAQVKAQRALLVCADLSALPLPDSYFDGVACLGVLTCMPQELHLSAVRELARVTRSGGVLVVQVYNAQVASAYDRVVGEGRFDNGMYYYTFSRAETCKLLHEGGWRVERVAGFGVVRHLCALVRGGMRAYKAFARILAPLEVMITRYGGSRFAPWGEYLYLTCVRTPRAV
jgi:ubiquinone/menaquinone biosynthesis C-methylase UbiE